MCVGDAVLRDPSFTTRAIALAAHLAELGPRPAASDGEARARAAVAAELDAIGLKVVTEPFEYRSFAIERITLELGGRPAEPGVLGLDPFEGRRSFAGEAVVVTDPAKASETMKGRIVVTNHPLMQLMIAELEPAVVICVAPDVLDAFVARGDLNVSLAVDGAPVTLR